MPKPTLGNQELELLRYIADHPNGVTVGAAADGFGAPRDLARSTVVTVMERLRKKGYLGRTKQEGVYRYTVASAQEEVLGDLIQRFVEKTLKGSLTPLVAYFANKDRLTTGEVAELERLLTKLQPTDTTPREEDGPDA